MHGRQVARWVIVSVCVAGMVAVGLRVYSRHDVPMTEGDSVWRLAYDVSFRAPEAGMRLRVAIPDGAPHSRIFREDLRYTGLKTERMRSAAETRELSVVTQRDGEFRLEARFDIHLSPRTRFRDRTTLAQLTAEQRAGYLRGFRTIQVRSAAVRERLREIQGKARNKTALVQGIFDFCHRHIAGDDDGPEDARGVLEQQQGTSLGRARAMVALCRAGKVPARLVTGFVVQESVAAQPHVWVEVLTNGHWEPFDPDNGYARDLPAAFLPARYDGTVAVRGSGLTELNSQFSITAIPPPGHALVRRGQHLTDILDLASLPVEMHQVVILLLLMPLGALVTAVFRTLIGIRTFGTFTPVLVALSFIYAHWQTGLVVFGLVLILGLATRSLLDRMKLLLVPRLSVILTLVVICLVFAVSLLDYLGLTPGADAVLLPMVILTMIIERFYVSTEEDGLGASLQMLFGTLLVGLCCYFVLQGEQVGRLLLNYPELHLFSLALLIGLGRYTGYRLTELWRFRDFAVPSSEETQPAF